MAGFEIRDTLAWIYGQGFPKSLDVSKSLDKAAATPDEVKQWEGWGTALKPAVEPIIMARKPLSEKTVIANVLKWGTGGINIGATRIGFDPVTINTFDNGAKPWGDAVGESFTSRTSTGRFPSNVLLSHLEGCTEVGTLTEPVGGGAKGSSGFVDGYDGDGWQGQDVTTPVFECVDGCPVKDLDEQTEGKITQGHWAQTKVTGFGKFGNGSAEYLGVGRKAEEKGGGASRFFYVAKANSKDRNEGLVDLPEKGKVFNGKSETSAGNAPGSVEDKFTTKPAKNFHPTVKPTELLRYLVKMVCPPDGVVLDPFFGSGSTGKAAILEGIKVIGIEMTSEYLPIIQGRIEYAIETYKEQNK
jgi:site-specific DNA-methyltransferase (adenine-specific)